MKDFKRPALNLIDPDGYYTFKYEMKLLNTIMKKKNILRIWSSKSNIHEYLLLLYLCSVYKDKEIRVVFSDELNKYCKTIGCMSEKEILVIKNNEHNLSNEEKENYKNEWENILKINNEIRYLKNGKIINTTFEKVEEIILKELKKEKSCKTINFIAHLMCNYIIDYYSSGEYFFLIKDLIKKNKIKIMESGENSFLSKRKKRKP